MSKITNITPELSPEAIHTIIDDLNEDQLMTIAQTSVNWMTGTDPVVDEDGFLTSEGVGATQNDLRNYGQLQKACWDKFVSNPQINSHVRDYMGSLTGMGFRVESQIQELQDKIDETIEDPRNNLSVRMTQYVARSEIEGELFLSFTLHTDGFVEIDFLDPSLISAGGESSSGIYHHNNKSMFPLVYRFTRPATNGKSNETLFLPSINLAHFPEMKVDAEALIKNDAGATGLYGKSTNKAYKKLGGLTTFVVTWDRGFLTNRNVSHLKTTLVWINHYESLKRWEIDHKKSAGSYLWVASITDSKAYRTWLKLTSEEKQETGLFAKKVPGGTIVLPPGINLECKNPNLSSISGQDTDIMQMVTSGLNRPEDMVNGSSSGSKEGIQASRGPQSDRTQDQLAYFERFLRFEFWRSVLLLCYRSGYLKETYSIKEAVEFKEQEPIFKKVTKKGYNLIEFEFPQSEVSDMEGKARALLGVKHGSVAESLGIPHEEIANKLGFGSYYKKRLGFATEEKTYPKTPLAIAIDAAEESAASQEPQNIPSPTSAPGPGDSEASGESKLIRRKI
jgi:hypothetical protein